MTHPYSLISKSSKERHVECDICFDGTCIFRMQSWSRGESTNVNFRLVTPTNDVASIQDALMTSDTSTIRASALDVRPSDQFESRDVHRTSTFVLIGDQTITTYLVAVDLPEQSLLCENTYDFTKIRRKDFNGSYILTTTIETSITKSSFVSTIHTGLS